MHVVISGLRLPTANFSTSGGLRSSFLAKPISNADKDRTPSFLPQWCGKLQISLPGPGIRCQGGRRNRPQRNGTSDGSDKLDKVRNSDGSSSSQEEIIQLFKRIQDSIAKETKKSKRRITPRGSDKNTSTESVLEDLRQHHLPRKQKQVRGRVSEQEFNALPGKTSVSEIKESAAGKTSFLPLQNKEREVEASASPAQNRSRLPRPASNFVKRSPVRSVALEKTEENEELPPTISGGSSESADIDKLKLPELKELAKSKGVKGFSKLKKRELVELLKGQSSSTFMIK